MQIIIYFADLWGIYIFFTIYVGTSHLIACQVLVLIPMTSERKANYSMFNKFCLRHEVVCMYTIDACIIALNIYTYVIGTYTDIYFMYYI